MLSNYLNEIELEIIKNEGYNEYGLRYSIDELSEPSLANQSMEEISKYVDAITFIKVKNKGCKSYLKGHLSLVNS
jgi:hypothetical protein